MLEAVLFFLILVFVILRSARSSYFMELKSINSKLENLNLNINSTTQAFRLLNELKAIKMKLLKVYDSLDHELKSYTFTYKGLNYKAIKNLQNDVVNKIDELILKLNKEIESSIDDSILEKVLLELKQIDELKEKLIAKFYQRIEYENNLYKKLEEINEKLKFDFEFSESSEFLKANEILEKKLHDLSVIFEKLKAKKGSELKMLEEYIDKIKKNIESIDAFAIEALELENKKLQDFNNTLKNTSTNFKIEITQYKKLNIDFLRKLNEFIEKFEKENKKLENSIKDLSLFDKEVDESTIKFFKRLEVLEAEIKRFDEEIEKRKNELLILKTNLENEYIQKRAGYDRKYIELEKKIKSIEDEINSKNEYIKTLKTEKELLKNRIIDIKIDCEKMDKLINDLRETISKNIENKKFMLQELKNVTNKIENWFYTLNKKRLE